ncbi:MAG: TlyA family RNA methyltransferase [Armatimonadota bacterium]
MAAPARVARARPAAGRIRLDHLVVARGLAPSRHQAESAIRAGEIFVDGMRKDKPGVLVPQGAAVERRARGGIYVSRGGIKLAAALDAFGVAPAGLVALDVGSSTGGFTDCLLQRGASRIYAVDVGRGLLHWRLRRDARVVVLEGRHAARLRPGDLPEPIDLATVDCSFISLSKVLPAVAALLREGGRVVALVKPQFEAGPKAAPRGVVRDPAVHEEVLRRVIGDVRALGLTPMGIVPSPLLGPQGNREFFVLAVKERLSAQGSVDNSTEAIRQAVRSGEPAGTRIVTGSAGAE